MKKTVSGIFLLSGFLAALCHTSCVMDMDILGSRWKKTESFNSAAYPEFRITGDAFRILILADIQLEYFSKDDDKAFGTSIVSRTLDMITADIKTYEPDLLILLGDNVGGAGFFNRIEAERLLTFLDSFRIPYAPVIGNHDGETFFSNKNDNCEERISEFFRKGRYSLFREGPVNLGIGNYGINIADENGIIVYSLILMDNGTDEYFSEEQVEWYQWFVEGVSAARYGAYSPMDDKVVPSMFFFHIPLPETYSLYEELNAANPALAAECFRESISGNILNYGMFDKMKELKSTTHLFFGHDHRNLLNSEYQGIRFIYCLKTGICNYHDKDRIGTTLVTIQDDAGKINVTVEFKNNMF